MIRRPLVFEIEKVNKEGIQKEIIVVENPLAGSFKVSNGKITAFVYMNEDNIDIFVKDKEGNIKRFKTEKVSV